MSLTVQAPGSAINGYAAGNVEENKKGVSEKGTVFAGNLKAGAAGSAIDEKRQNARNQAMKLIHDARTNDDKAVQSRDDMKKRKDEKLSELHEYDARLKEIEDKKKKVQEEYGVDEDSQEQRDLELLEKYQNYVNGSRSEQFTKEDVERLKELENKPWSEYQSKVLQLNAETGSLQDFRSKAADAVRAATEAIADAKIDQLKSQDMLKARDSADSITDAAESEIVGMVISDAVDHIDEVRNDAQEKAEEAQEKKDEQQERIDQAKEKKSEQQERIAKAKEEQENQKQIIEGAAEMSRLAANTAIDEKNTGNLEETQKQIQKILKDNNLMDEDLKGIKIDFIFN